MILNVLAPGMEKTVVRNHPSWQKENSPMFLWGVVMSGRMDEARVKRLLPSMKERAAKKGRNLEILFHPGTVLREELGEEFCNHGANGFHVSEGRHVEQEAVMSLTEEDLR